ncbi:DUF6264 family protein [Microbacterium sp. Marseille-Q6965]|uniref:DUF6264 family protein n=1 Tax=Microbacterium sp. Marseille-Q6965 TaxID=2965072 RepID=UPI0021B79A15|nr:DUF6264 family protein [Microbacterium sp. Marseille-Q6965]
MSEALPPRPHGDEQPRPPRPQFGEYASPEEQQRRIQANPLPVPTPAPAAGAEEPAPVVPVAGSGASTGRLIDRVVTVALLVYGLLNVIVTIPQLTDYVTYAENLLGMMGVDATLSDPAGGRGWGVAAALVMGLGWLATAALSYLRLRAGRTAFWIPIVGAVVFLGASGLLMTVPLLNDPAVLDAIMRAGTP